MRAAVDRRGGGKQAAEFADRATADRYAAIIWQTLGQPATVRRTGDSPIQAASPTPPGQPPPSTAFGSGALDSLDP